MKLGIDTGGTFTDAVLLDVNNRVAARAKSPTTHGDLVVGVNRAVERVLSEAPSVSAADVGMVGLSTTLATNAVVEGRGGRAGLIMAGFGPSALERGGLAQALGEAPALFLAGGHQATGREQAPLDLAALERELPRMSAKADAFAVCAQFATRNPAHERAIAATVTAVTGKPCSLSCELAAKLDAPKRALTALLNAQLLPEIKRLLDAVGGALARHGIEAPLMVVKGDGSLMRADFAAGRPIETVLSGPAASLVGAAALCGVGDAVVADVGGTTTDVAVMRGGRPGLSPEGAVVGGWRTMVEAVDLITSGLGGDSAVQPEPSGGVKLGPARMIPISVLATRQPWVKEVLAGQLKRYAPRPEDGVFVIALTAPEEAVRAFGPSRAKLWAMLGEGLRSLEQLVARERMAIPLRRLEERGLVRRAGFTPTDAAVLSGLQDGGDVEAAGLAAELLGRGLKPSTRDASTVADLVLDEARVRSAAAILEATLPPNDRFRELLRPPLTGSTREALRREADPTHRGAEGEAASLAQRPLVRLGLRLNLPVVAVGGPAPLFYPHAAAALGTRAIIPGDHQVCNAVGAVTGLVARSVSLNATRRDDETFTVHLPDRQMPATSSDAAEAHLREAAGEMALREALQAGAEDPDLAFKVERASARLDDGTEFVSEVRVVATASGRPALALGRSGASA